jgi:hypothetical protein
MASGVSGTLRAANDQLNRECVPEAPNAAPVHWFQVPRFGLTGAGRETLQVVAERLAFGLASL